MDERRRRCCTSKYPTFHSRTHGPIIIHLKPVLFRSSFSWSCPGPACPTPGQIPGAPGLGPGASSLGRCSWDAPDPGVFTAGVPSHWSVGAPHGSVAFDRTSHHMVYSQFGTINVAPWAGQILNGFGRTGICRTLHVNYSIFFLTCQRKRAPECHTDVVPTLP